LFYVECINALGIDLASAGDQECGVDDRSSKTLPSGGLDRTESFAWRKSYDVEGVVNSLHDSESIQWRNAVPFGKSGEVGIKLRESVGGAGCTAGAKLGQPRDGCWMVGVFLNAGGDQYGGIEKIESLVIG
jgi:hypothetical protein